IIDRYPDYNPILPKSEPKLLLPHKHNYLDTARLSDYHDVIGFPKYVPKQNGTMLRNNKLDAIASCLEIEHYLPMDAIYNCLQYDMLEPNLGDYQAGYDELFEKAISLIQHGIEWNTELGYHTINVEVYTLARAFVEYWPRVNELMESEEPLSEADQTFLQVIRQKLKQRMDDNAIIAKDKLRGISWITENPGRQWTASLNPIVKDPRDWYGYRYQSFTTGDPEIETTLNLFRLRPTYFQIIPKDIFNKILCLILY
ncbi:MAG: hypothetical protein ACMG6E_03795, partial [Candidatus Roizmanbacteria bacterium]